MIPVPAGFDRSNSGSGRIQNSGSGRSLEVPKCNKIGNFAPNFKPAFLPVIIFRAKPFYEKVKMKILTLRKFNLTKLNTKCLKAPESNKIGHFAPNFRPVVSILSTD